VSTTVTGIIDRYLIKEIGLTLLSTVLVLLSIVLMHRLSGYLNKVASGSLSLDYIWLLIGLQAVYFLVILIPLAFLLSLMLTLGRLYRDHEVTALIACGYGPFSIYRAILLLAIPLSIITAVLSMMLVPMIMDFQFAVLAKANKEAEISFLKPGIFRELQGQYMIYIGALSQSELRDIFIQTCEPNGDITIITGAQGRQVVGQDGIRNVVLEHGYRYRGTPGRGDYEILSFERAILRVDIKPHQQEWQHREALPTLSLFGSSDPSYIAELHMRLNSPIQVLVIAIWAPLMARVKPREGRYSRIVIAVLIYAINFNLAGIGEAWLNQGLIGGIIGLWWVHIMFVMFGILLFLYTNMSSSEATSIIIRLFLVSSNKLPKTI
jgi:lipopolysaccharide export system permease protein